LLHGLDALGLSRMFNKVLDVCENQTMLMTHQDKNQLMHILIIDPCK